MDRGSGAKLSRGRAELNFDHVLALTVRAPIFRDASHVSNRTRHGWPCRGIAISDLPGSKLSWHSAQARRTEETDRRWARAQEGGRHKCSRNNRSGNCPGQNRYAVAPRNGIFLRGQCICWPSPCWPKVPAMRRHPMAAILVLMHLHDPRTRIGDWLSRFRAYWRCDQGTPRCQWPK